MEDAAQVPAPQPYADIIDAACDRDRRWFERHPGEDEYVRPLVDGELWPFVPEPPPHGQQWHMRVRLIGPGLRTRMLVLAPTRQ